jgi:cholest-4-en-3-one 26-monooxygenase
VLVETLLDAMPNIELPGNLRRLRSSFVNGIVNGIKEMPVRLDEAPRHD